MAVGYLCSAQACFPSFTTGAKRAKPSVCGWISWSARYSRKLDLSRDDVGKSHRRECGIQVLGKFEMDIVYTTPSLSVSIQITSQWDVIIWSIWTYSVTYASLSELKPATYCLSPATPSGTRNRAWSIDIECNFMSCRCKKLTWRI